MDNIYFTIRKVTLKDMLQIRKLDKLSGSFVAEDISDYVEDYGETDFAWCIEDLTNGIIIGYLTIGGAENYDLYQEGDLCLSDVFILPEYRNKGIGNAFVSMCIKEFEYHRIILTVLDDSLIYFYEKLGFKVIDQSCGTMLKDRVK